MPKFTFAKLVRDKITDHQIASGARPTFRILSPDEHKRALVDKIAEEAKEIMSASMDDIAAEIADVQQALDDLKALYNITDKAVAEAQAVKITKNGAFSKGIFVESVELEESDRWVAYYRENAERYREIV